MKYLILTIAIFTFLSSCNSDDDSSDGQCWGAFRERDDSGNITWEHSVKMDCEKCNSHMYYECPNGESCFDYYGEPGYNILGVWECD